MSHKDRRRWRWSIGLGAGLLLGNWAYGAEPAPVPPPAPPALAHASLPVFTLDDCLHYAHDHQPNLAAARASLAAAETQFRALHEMHAAPFLPGGRELPIRREQASLGVCIAQAALVQAEYDTDYSVRRTYLAVQFARAQLAVVEYLLDEKETRNELEKKVNPGLKRTNDQAREKAKDKESNATDKIAAERVSVYFHLAKARREEAASGVVRALAALREAMGASEDCFQLVDEGWFQAGQRDRWLAAAVPCKGEIVALALARRGEVSQAQALLDVHHLEVDAQCKTTALLPTARTFAAGADIHARQVPPAFDDSFTSYRPGALAPEMPTFLIGPRCERQTRAGNFDERAAAVAEKTRNLIILDAEEVFLRWVETRARTLETAQAAEAAGALDKIIPDNANRETEATNQVLEAQARSAYNEALYSYLISLAALERVTAGGFSSGLGCASLPPAEPCAPK